MLVLIKKVFKILVKTKIYVFKLPSKKKIIIYDPEVATQYKNLYSNLDYCYLHIRYEYLYLRIVFSALVEFLKLKEKRNIGFYSFYINKYIDKVDPKVIISFTDYNSYFWKLKKKLPSKKIYTCSK